VNKVPRKWIRDAIIFLPIVSGLVVLLITALFSQTCPIEMIGGHVNANVNVWDHNYHLL